MMKKFSQILLIFLIVSCQIQAFLSIATTYNEAWKNFLRENNKSYSNSEERAKRKEIFIENFELINSLNRNYNRNKLNYTCEVNQFADLTNEEFQKLFIGLASPSISFQSHDNITEDMMTISSSPSKLSASSSPDEVDWRPFAVTSVKNQLKCGACWAFASVGALEGQYSKKFNRLVSLSTQNLIDCVKTDNTDGCDGGIMPDAFKWVQANGIMTESTYPYKANDNSKCRYNINKKVGTCSGNVFIPYGSEAKLQEATASIGPIAIGIDASNPSIQFYANGIYYEKKCNPNRLNHAVLIVGYGSSGDGQDYWIVKNSWGPGWGEKGFFRLARNRNNHCGVASYACYPLVN